MAGSTKNGTDVVLAPLGMLIGQVDYASGEQAFDTSGSTETTLLPSLVVADQAGEGLAFTGTIADRAPAPAQSFTGQLQVKQSDIDAGGTLVIGAKAIDNQGDQVFASK